MGRNSHPKIGEWRDGELYDIRADQDGYPAPGDGKLVVFTRTTMVNGEEKREVLASAYAEGLQSLLASFFEDGFSRGKREGILEAKRDVRRALGISEH